MKKHKDSNIVYTTLKELEKLGYKQVKPTYDKKNNVNPPEPESMLCLTNKNLDLWCELSISDIKHSKVTPDKFLILYK